MAAACPPKPVGQGEQGRVIPLRHCGWHCDLKILVPNDVKVAKLTISLRQVAFSKASDGNLADLEQKIYSTSSDRSQIEGRPGTTLQTASLLPRTMEKGLGESLECPDSIGDAGDSIRPG